MQNILIRNGNVEMIMEWADGRKANPEDYPGYELVFLKDARLDPTKQYEYSNGIFKPISKKEVI